MIAKIPRPEYPRPDFERREWLNLNGEWDFEFDDADTGERERWYLEKKFSGKILVPYCFQSELSGIHDRGLHEVMWYNRSFTIPADFRGKRVLLHFGAVDYYAKVWVNGCFLGSHKGGHTPFKIEITDFLQETENRLVVRVEDRYETVQPRGKQYWKEKPDRCWYTATSGIWQTVWLEAAGAVYIDRIRLTPDIDRQTVLAEVFLDQRPAGMALNVTVRFKSAPELQESFFGRYLPEGEDGSRRFSFDADDRILRFTLNIRNLDAIDELHLWSPENPNLYDIEFCLEQAGQVVDRVKSYFGMRKIAVCGDRVYLNNRPYYQRLILDQGYWPESLLTPPSDAALRYDVEIAKRMGFNGARKHQKIEDPRYYYWADRLGFLVWGEMPSAYHFNIEAIENVTVEWLEFIRRDYNHPSIVTWVPLNESWGVRGIFTDRQQQNFARALYSLTKSADGTRLVSTNDGWEQVDADICAIHDYTARGEDLTKIYADQAKLLGGEKPGRPLYAEGVVYEGQPVILTEYGGIAFETENRENWGYGAGVKDETGFIARYTGLTNAVKAIPYLRGYCYTQLTDVMQEINGLLTADRRLKVSLEKIREVNQNSGPSYPWNW
jgi:beta-galactosidase/beta-glucuronidase